jgi:hypothetical protein
MDIDSSVATPKECAEAILALLDARSSDGLWPRFLDAYSRASSATMLVAVAHV